MSVLKLPHKGDLVRVRRGAQCRSTNPQRKGGYVARTSRVVRVAYATEEVTTRGYEQPAMVNWGGSGGYWCWCALADTEPVTPWANEEEGECPF